MLEFFKKPINTLSASVMLLLALALRLATYFKEYTITAWPQKIAPLSKLTLVIVGEGLLHNLVFNLIVSFCLLFAMVISIILLLRDQKKSILKNSLSLWLFVLILHLFPQFVLISPELLALCFVVFALNSLLSLEQNRLKYIFNFGLLIGIASQFYLPTIFFSLLGIYALIQSKKLNIRILIIYLIGLFIPFLWYLSICLVFDQEPSIFQNIVLNRFQIQSYNQKELLSSFMLLLYTLVSLYFVYRYKKSQPSHINVLLNIFYVYIFCCIIIILFQNNNSIHIILFLLLPTALFLNIFFNSFKHKLLANISYLTLLLSIIVNFLYFLN